MQNVSKLYNITGIQHVGGDMLESVPQGDAILIKVHHFNSLFCYQFFISRFTISVYNVNTQV